MVLVYGCFSFSSGASFFLFNDGFHHSSDLSACQRVLEEEVVRPVFFCNFAVFGKVVACEDANDEVRMVAFDFSRQLETIFSRQPDVHEDHVR